MCAVFGSLSCASRWAGHSLWSCTVTEAYSKSKTVSKSQSTDSAHTGIRWRMTNQVFVKAVFPVRSTETRLPKDLTGKVDHWRSNELNFNKLRLTQCEKVDKVPEMRQSSDIPSVEMIEYLGEVRLFLVVNWIYFCLLRNERIPKHNFSFWKNPGEFARKPWFFSRKYPEVRAVLNGLHHSLLLKSHTLTQATKSRFGWGQNFFTSKPLPGKNVCFHKDDLPNNLFGKP